MKRFALRILSILVLEIFASGVANATPPFGGTIFLDPEIITAADPTTFRGVVDAGRGERWMFDRRVNNWVYLNAFLFEASFEDGLSIEIQVNPEFGNATTALVEASKYAPVIGRLPTCLRADVETVWIHRGNQPFGGGNNNLLIHTAQADQYAASGILEETLVHEAAHTSLDTNHGNAPEWLAAQASDGEFISTYARDNPNREDIAESFLVYLALRYRAERIPQGLADIISQTIPHRMAYFDNQDLNLYPMVVPDANIAPITGGWLLTWNSRPGRRYALDMTTDFAQWAELIGSIASQGDTTSLSLATQAHQLPAARAFFKVRELASP